MLLRLDEYFTASELICLQFLAIIVLTAVGWGQAWVGRTVLFGAYDIHRGGVMKGQAQAALWERHGVRGLCHHEGRMNAEGSPTLRQGRVCLAHSPIMTL